MSEIMIISKPHATIEEYKNAHKPNDNEVVIMCSQAPDHFNLQIRTHKGIGDYGAGKQRDMIAQVNLTIKDVEEILAHMKAQYPQL